MEIDELIAQALKSKNKIELKVYRNLKARILEFKTAKNAKPYTLEEELKIISKEVKKLEDAILEFFKADRQDLVSEYRDELEVLKKLLPEPVKDGQIRITLQEWCVENNFYEKSNYNEKYQTTIIKLQIPKKEMGNAIKYLKSKFPTADGKMISDIVKEYVV